MNNGSGGHEVNRWSLEIARQMGLSDLAYRVLSVMLVKRDFKTNRVTVTAGQVGEMIGKSKATAWRAISMLKAAGLISEVRKKETGGHPINTYVLNLTIASGPISSARTNSQKCDALPTSTASASIAPSPPTSGARSESQTSPPRKVRPKIRKSVEMSPTDQGHISSRAPLDWERFGLTQQQVQQRGLSQVDFDNYRYMEDENK